MISYGPRAKKQFGILTGRWDFTETDHFGQVSAAGYCQKYKLEGNHDGHHTSAEDAVKCFLDYVLDHLKFDGRNFMKLVCVNCGQETFKCGMIKGEPFVPICGEFCFEKFRTTIRERFRSGKFEVYAEACDDGK